ncbi:MAG: hypothetical protein WCF03_19300, partial [Nitrososphaeraceae archaeon]
SNSLYTKFLKNCMKNNPAQSNILMWKITAAFRALFLDFVSKKKTDRITNEDLLLPNLLATCC